MPLDLEEQYETKFRLPSDIPPHELGMKKNWPALKAFLDPFKEEKFLVIDSGREFFLRDIRIALERDRGGHTYFFGAAIHHFLRGQGDPEMLGDLISLGVDADSPGGGNFRPSHLCGMCGLKECLEIIYHCRPDLTAVNDNGDIPKDAPQGKYGFNPRIEQKQKAHRKSVREFWDQIGDRPNFFTLARLAAEKSWCHVFHFMRRDKKVHESELFDEHEGRNVLQWAMYHDKQGVVAELEYFFGNAYRNREVRLLRQEVERLRNESRGVELNDVKVELDSTKAALKTAQEELKTTRDKLSTTEQQVNALLESVKKLEEVVGVGARSEASDQSSGIVSSPDLDGKRSHPTSEYGSEPAEDSRPLKRMRPGVGAFASTSANLASYVQQHGNVVDAPEPDGVVAPAFETDVADGVSGLVLQTTQLMIKWQLKLQHMRRNSRPH